VRALKENAAEVALYLLLPAGLTTYLAFSSGGYFPGATAVAALVLATVLVLRAVAAEEPLGGLSRPVAIAAGALMLYGLWNLVSAGWSDSPARALVEFNRVLLYLLALLLFGSMRHSPKRVRLMAWGLALAFTAVCTAGLLTRTLPDVFTIAQDFQTERLSYPIGYWNALGMMASLGVVLCVHLASSEREPRLARVLGAAAVPILAVALLFTFSRGPMAAVVVGLVVYALLGRPRALVLGVLAAGPATAVALVAAYRADLLASREPTTPQAVSQGHDVAVVVAICVVAAAVARMLLLVLDPKLERLRLEARTKLALAAAAVGLFVLGGVVVLTGTDLSDRLDAQSGRFARSNLEQTGDLRDRLTDPGINRLDHWEIALDGFDAHPMRGNGAGTYALLWDRDRPNRTDSEEAHSLYLEVLAELGLVGMGLLGVALVALLVGVARRVRGPQRPLYAVVLSLSFIWLFHAALDWGWEIASVTLWLFTLTVAAAAASPDWAPAAATPEPRRRQSKPLVRALLVASCLGLALTPGLLAASQARLRDGIRAYGRGDCDEAQKKADASLSVLGERAEPYQILGYCYVGGGRSRAAVQAIEAAIERDPRNWEYRYDLAIVRAAGGLDPRAATRTAWKLNPRELRVRQAAERFRTRKPREWRRAAAEIGLPRR
jgi:O-antigen ligase